MNCAYYNLLEWQPWRFEPTPKGFWGKENALTDFMQYLFAYICF
jgi:hypothetical protein